MSSGGGSKDEKMTQSLLKDVKLQKAWTGGSKSVSERVRLMKQVLGLAEVLQHQFEEVNAVENEMTELLMTRLMELREGLLLRVDNVEGVEDKEEEYPEDHVDEKMGEIFVVMFEIVHILSEMVHKWRRLVWIQRGN